MSTQQVLGVVGGVVGAFFGYPQLGFLVGSLVGGLLTPGEKTEGPRVDDLKVQVSTYGAGIPILYGTERIGGNVVWSTDKIETSDTQGGKGSEPEHTTYRYFVHMGIVLCETPRDGSTVSIVQIFQDGKLIYDARTGIPIGSALASAENPHAFFVLYQGHADQLPDPIEELHEGGPGSVPAYRGVVRIRMNAIECPGGRIPQFSFVLSTNAEAATVSDILASLPDYRGDIGVPTNGSSAWNLRFIRSVVSQTFECYYFGHNTATKQSIITLPAATYQHFPAPVVGSSVAEASVLRVVPGPAIQIDIIDIEKGVIREAGQISIDEGIAIGKHGCAYDKVTDRYVILMANGPASNQPFLLPAQSFAGVFVGECAPVAMYDSIIYAVLIKTIGTSRFLFVDSMDADTGLILSSVQAPLAAVASINMVHRSMIRADETGVYIYLNPLTAAGPSLYRLDGTRWTVLAANASLPGSLDWDNPGAFWASNAGALLGPAVAPGATYYFMRFGALTISPVSIADIITDLCERADEARFDVSGIPSSDTLIGYKLQNPASARSNIDPLLTAFAIYIVDEDGLIKFKKYEDIISQAEITYDELGQAEDGAEPADAMPLNRAQEIDMPRSVSVSYIEPTFDYQTASEKEVRQITEATEDLIIEMPMATTSDHAKQVASMILYAKWRGQNTRSFKTSRKYAFLSPGDGVTVEYPRGTFRLWRITSMTDTGVLCEFNVEPGDAELYTQTAVGASGYVGQQVAPLAPPTRLQLLDIPILRDADNNAGLYAAMAGFGSGWSGAELFAGDDAATLESRGTVAQEAVIGVAETALGNWTRGIADETSLVTVDVGYQALNSITYDQMATGSVNVAALGAPGRWEIIKFRSAASLGAGRYTLSGFVRGLRGTEWARGTHQIGDTFVLLSLAGTLRPNFEAGSIGQSKTYKAVSKGRSFNGAATQAYVNTAEGLETFSPTNLRRNLVSGGIEFVWVRRTRLSENWLAGIVPLGEAQERYELALYTNSTFDVARRVIPSNSRSAIYTTAMQAEDGYVSGPLYVRVYQISDVVGRGHPLEITI